MSVGEGVLPPPSPSSPTHYVETQHIRRAGPAQESVI